MAIYISNEKIHQLFIEKKKLEEIVNSQEEEDLHDFAMMPEEHQEKLNRLEFIINLFKEFNINETLIKTPKK